MSTLSNQSCGCLPLAVDLDGTDSIEAALDRHINSSLQLGAAVSQKVAKAEAGRPGYPNYSWKEDGPFGQEAMDGPPVRQGVGTGRGRTEGVPTGATQSSSGNNANRMVGMYSDATKPGAPVTLENLAQSIKSLNHGILAILKAAEDEEEDEEESEEE